VEFKPRITGRQPALGLVCDRLSNDKVIATRIANIGEKRQSDCEFGSPPAKGDAPDPRWVKENATAANFGRFIAE
jgi:hypothetical protein